MLGWVGDIEQATLDNDNFRAVVFTGEHTQLTVMRLGPGEDIGRVHHNLDQFLRIEEVGLGWSLEEARTRSMRRTTCKTTGRSSSRPECGTTS